MVVRLSQPCCFECMLGDLEHDRQEVMVQRHRKYGPHNIGRFGVFGTLTRLGDKFARLEHLLGDGFRESVAEGVTPDESIEDTLIDLANYADIMRAQLRGWWTADRCPELRSASEEGEHGGDPGPGTVRGYPSGEAVPVQDLQPPGAASYRASERERG